MTDALKLADDVENGVDLYETVMLVEGRSKLIAAALRLAFADLNVSDAEGDYAKFHKEGRKPRTERLNAARRARSDAFTIYRAAASA